MALIRFLRQKLGRRREIPLPLPRTQSEINRVIEAKARAVGISFEEQKKISLERVSMHRMVSPYDIANMALYLASDTGSNITGQALSVCAGVEMLG